MSPLWRDEVAIYLSPRKIALARRARGLKGRLAAAAEVAVADGSSSDPNPAFTHLAQILTEPAWQNVNARVVVADVVGALRDGARARLAPRSMPRGAHMRAMSSATRYGEGIADWQRGARGHRPRPHRGGMRAAARPHGRN